MKFRTEYIAQPSNLSLNPQRPIALIGSCFSRNISRKMLECGWQAFNGAGTLYNPLSIEKVMRLLLFDSLWKEHLKDSVFQHEGLVSSWLFDSHFSSNSAEKIITAIAECRREFLSVLKDAQALIVTFGTSWCYFLEADPTYIVANCHKQHPATFTRRRIAIDEIVSHWKCLLNQIENDYPDLTLIFTVSPVRHLKDGFEGNSRSKATLLLAVESICNKCSNSLYFPAYEIVQDDLRDYRFYAPDLLHPSEQAVDYIWEKFRQTFINCDGEKILREGLKTFKASQHRRIIS